MAKFKVLSLGRNFTDSLDPERGELASVKGDVEVVLARCTTEDQLIEAARDADAILGGSPLFTRRVMGSLPKCKVIVTYSVGYDTLDVEAATENGIIIVNNPSPEWCVEEVANHTIALILICAKKLGLMNELTKQARWADAKRAIPTADPVHGQTLGLIGCGNIGRLVAKKAQVFGLRVLGCDPYVKKPLAQEAGIALVSQPTLLKESDFVSLHTPLTKETRHFMGEAQFSQMKPSAYLINTSRGPVVDEAALVKALQGKRIAGAGLDVFEKEPVSPDNPLLKMDNVVAIPHTASTSTSALLRQPVNPSQEVARVLSGKWPKNVVNKGVEPRVRLT